MGHLKQVDFTDLIKLIKYMGRHGRAKTEWMSLEEIEDFFDYHIERGQEGLYPNSALMGMLSIAGSIRIYIGEVISMYKKREFNNYPDWYIELEPIYERLCELDDIELAVWFFGLENSCLDYVDDDEERWFNNYKWVNEYKVFLIKKKRIELYDAIVDAMDCMEYEYDNEFSYLSKYLDSIGIKNNIDEYHKVLETGLYPVILERIKIEKRVLCTESMDKDKLLKLCKEYGYFFMRFADFMYDCTDVDASIGMSNRKFAYLMETLKIKGLIRNDWQSMIVKYKIRGKNGKYLTRRDLSEAAGCAKDTAECFIYGVENKKQQEYADIKKFVESL